MPGVKSQVHRTTLTQRVLIGVLMIPAIERSPEYLFTGHPGLVMTCHAIPLISTWAEEVKVECFQSNFF